MGTWQVERLALQSVYADLARCIDVSELLPVLFQNGVISGLDAKERIERHGETTMDKAVWYVKISIWYILFIYA